MPVPRLRVLVGFDSAPDDPVQQWTDVSTDVRFMAGLSMTRGRSDEFSTVEPGRLSLTLDNTSAAYTFDGTRVVPGKRIRVEVSADGESWSPRWDGYVDGWPMAWDRVVEQPTVAITATDRLARFSAKRTLRDALHEELGQASPTPGSVFG